MSIHQRKPTDLGAGMPATLADELKHQCRINRCTANVGRIKMASEPEEEMATAGRWPGRSMDITQKARHERGFDEFVGIEGGHG